MLSLPSCCVYTGAEDVIDSEDYRDDEPNDSFIVDTDAEEEDGEEVDGDEVEDEDEDEEDVEEEGEEEIVIDEDEEEEEEKEARVKKITKVRLLGHVSRYKRQYEAQPRM
jgi:hypothetical protein